jgi:NAD(P)-dependent dehydrogenase (short-subunit alcohol dehydrogenase family)
MNRTVLDLSNTVAFVTGTNKKNGIGRAIVQALLAEGVRKVYATARDASQLHDIFDDRVVKVSLDVTDRNQVAKLGELYPDVTLVINNAGYAGFNTSLETNAAEVAVKEMEVNYIAPLLIVQAFSSNLKDKENTGVVNVASIASLVSFPIAATYSASKAATHSLTQAQRRDLGQKTLVVGVYPGPIDTDMAEDIPMEKTQPSEVGIAVVEALKKGVEDVFPDAMAAQLHEGWRSDAKAVEQMMAQPQSATA